MRKILSVIIFIFVFCFVFLICTSALETSFDTQSVPKEDYGNYELKNFEFFTEEPETGGIYSYAVHSDGRFALLFADDEFLFRNSTQTLCVYDADGSFQYGFRFFSKKPYPDWSGDNVLLVYSSYGIELSPNGEILEIVALPDTMNNSDLKMELSQPVHTVGDKVYKASAGGIKGFIDGRYDMLTVTDSDGNRSVIYQANTNTRPKTRFILYFVLIAILLALPAVIIPLIIRKKYPKSKKYI